MLAAWVIGCGRDWPHETRSLSCPPPSPSPLSAVVGRMWAQVTEYVGASDRKHVGASDREHVGASDSATLLSLNKSAKKRLGLRVYLGLGLGFRGLGLGGYADFWMGYSVLSQRSRSTGFQRIRNREAL